MNRPLTSAILRVGASNEANSTGVLLMKQHIILEWATVEVIVTAYNNGILAYGAMTLRGGEVKVSLDIRARFNILTVELAHGPVNTLTLWSSEDDRHDDIIRLHFGEK